MTSGLSMPDNPPVPSHPSNSAPATNGPHLRAHRCGNSYRMRHVYAAINPSTVNTAVEAPTE